MARRELITGKYWCKNRSSTHGVSIPRYKRAIAYLGKHQAGVITPEQKHASFIALNLTVTTIDEVKKYSQL